MLLSTFLLPVAGLMMSLQQCAYCSERAVQTSDILILSKGAIAPPGSHGTLELTSSGLRVSTDKGNQMIARTSVIAVSSERQLIERGGTTGTVLRMAIPYGGGSALALLSPKHIALLTISYQEVASGFHSLVATVPEADVDRIVQSFPSGAIVEQRDTTLKHVPRCSTTSSQANAVQIAAIQDQSQTVPKAYKALLYEDLADRASRMDGVSQVFRAGADHKGMRSCSELTVELAMVTYSAGNQMVRAATGPVGLFVGKASVAYLLTVRDAQGTPLLAKNFQANVRGDRQDTGLAGSMSKQVVKEVQHFLKHQQQSNPALGEQE